MTDVDLDADVAPCDVPPSTARTMLEALSQWAGLVIVSERIHPTYNVLCPGGTVGFMPPQIGNKDLSNGIVRAMLRQLDAVAYAMCVEADALWIERSDPDHAAKTAAAIRDGIVGHPNAVEIVAFQAEDRTTQVAGERRIITENGARSLGPLRLWLPTMSAGRMVGLLPPPAGRAQ